MQICVGIVCEYPQIVEPDDVTVLLTAPTGTALHLSGMTALICCSLLMCTSRTNHADFINANLDNYLRWCQHISSRRPVSITPVRQTHNIIFSVINNCYAKQFNSGSLWLENFKWLNYEAKRWLLSCELLCRIRTATHTDSDITVLKSREISPQMPNYSNHDVTILTLYWPKPDISGMSSAVRQFFMAHAFFSACAWLILCWKALKLLFPVIPYKWSATQPFKEAMSRNN